MPLPAGLALNPSTGAISGVPTTPGSYSFTLRVRDAQGTQRDQPATIVIAPYTPPSLVGALAGFSNRSVAYSSGLAVVDGIGPFVWSIASGVLPAGISINASTGLISGTPTDTSYTDRSITVRVVDANGSAAQSAQTIRYADVLALSGALATGVQGSAYSDGFDRAGGHSPFVFAITSGTLPVGLSFNTATGVISGTPASTSSTPLTIRVTDASGAQASRSGTLTVASAYTPIDITGSITNNSQSVETLSSFSITPSYAGVSVTGGSGTINYSWVRLSGSTNISPGSSSSLATSFVGSVAPGSTEAATFRVTASDGISSDTLDVSISVTNTYVAMSLSAADLPFGTRSVAYSGSLTRGGGRAPFTFAVISGTLPTGITLNSSTGALSGTPTDTSYTSRFLTFRVTDSLGAVVDASGNLGYRNFPSISYALGAAMRTRSYSRLPTLAPGGHGVLSIAITSGTLPAGLSLNALTGEISGTPTDTSYGNRTLAFQLTDTAGNIVTQSGVVLKYADNLAIAGTYPGGTAGVSYSSSALSASGGHGGNVWSLAGGSLPSGLSLNAGSGALTGTPSSAGTFGFTVRVTDAEGFTATSGQSVAIGAALSVSISPVSASGFVSTPGGPPTSLVTTNSVTATASGGSPGYTFNGWTRISGSTNISANSPSNATTVFSGTISPGFEVATFRATFTDSAASTAFADVEVDLNYFNGT